MNIQYDVVGKSGVVVGREDLVIAYMNDVEIASAVGRKMGLMEVDREAFIAGQYDGLGNVNLAIIDEHDRGGKGNASDILFHPLVKSVGLDHRLLSVWCWHMGNGGVVPLLEFTHPDYGQRAFRVDLIEARNGSENYQGLEIAVEQLVRAAGLGADEHVWNCCLLSQRTVNHEHSEFNCERNGAFVSASFVDYWNHGMVGDFDILLASFDVKGISFKRRIRRLRQIKHLLAVGDLNG